MVKPQPDSAGSREQQVDTALAQQVTLDFSFSSPICRGFMPEVEQRRDEIAAAVLELRRNDPAGIQRSNLGGWQSGNLAGAVLAEPLADLVNRLSIATVAMLTKLQGRDHSMALHFRKLWFNVNEAGAWNTPHDHNTTWSGILFLAGQYADMTKLVDRPEEGDVVIYNPVSGVRLRGFPNAYVHRPHIGQLLMFPGYLLHMVVPHTWSTPRITLAFDADQRAAAAETRFRSDNRE